MLTPSLLRNLKYPAVIRTHPKKGNRPGANVTFDVMIAAIDATTDPYVTERVILETPSRSRQTFTYTNQEIRSGMYLEFEDTEYAIKGVAPYPEADGYVFYQLFLEDIQK